MNALIPYLFFNGTCREAMNFYQRCFGGNLEIMTNADAPKDACPNGMELIPEQIMHACLTQGDLMLMASDNPTNQSTGGDTLSININCTSIQQTEKLFKMLSDGGTVTMPLADTFWGSHFGMLTDKYGFHWMLNCPLQQQEA